MQQVNNTIPRVFVNIMTIFNLSQVWDIAQQSEYCKVCLGSHHID